MTLDPKNTIVIADFDGTLNNKIVNGKHVSSFASLLQHNVEFMTEAGVQEIHAIAAHYYPIEIDPSIPRDEKDNYMQEWWEQCYRAYKHYRITKKMITETANSPFYQLRDGLLSFLHYLADQKIPLILYSANALGGDSIQMILEKYHAYTPNIRICSNHLLFDTDGTFVDVQHPIITSANKTGETLIKNGFLSQTPKERHCLLLGDTLDDVRMTEGLNFETVYRVAFGDSESSAFKERFDLVLPIDGGYEPITALFDTI